MRYYSYQAQAITQAHQSRNRTMENSKAISFAKSQLELAENGGLIFVQGVSHPKAFLYLAGFNDSRDEIGDNKVFVSKADAEECCKEKVIYVHEIRVFKAVAISCLARKVKIEENRGEYL